MEGYSVKTDNNRPTFLKTQNVFNIFNSDSNYKILSKKVYQHHKALNGSKNYLTIRNEVPLRMYMWSMQNIDQHIPATVQTIDFYNIEFLARNADLYLTNLPSNLDSNVYRQKISLKADSEQRSVLKDASQLLAHDYHSLDVWEPQKVYVANDKFRYNNAVPWWQRNMHTRAYDKDTKSLTHENAERASLDNFSRGFAEAMKALEKKKDSLSKFDT